jgi:N-formylglutamate amidohydrolase
MTLGSLLFHIPHASTHFPFRKGFYRPELVGGEVDKLTDWYTDRIFRMDGVTALLAEFSRVFCDVERFVPDELEPMGAKGMGYYFTKSDDGQHFRHEGEWKEIVLRDFYRPHHRRLAELVRQKLEATGTCCLIDGHSFAVVPFVHENDQNPNRPDICLGTEGVHTPPWLVDAVRSVYEAAGYSVELNRPYAGSMVPLEFLGTDPRVLSIMIEVNRRLYLKNGGAVPKSLERLQGLTEAVVTKVLEAWKREVREGDEPTTLYGG